MVSVEHHSIGSFAKDIFALFDGVVYELRSVHDDIVLDQLFPLIFQQLKFGFSVVGDACSIADEFIKRSLLLNKVLPVENVCNSQALTEGLESVSWADAF